MEKYYLYITIFVFAFFSDLNAQEISTKDLSKYKIPDLASKLNGWEGLKISKGERCKECCTLKFPKKYGMESQSQFNKLVNIIRLSPAPKQDIACYFPIDEFGLNQMLKLAIKYQHKLAAEVLISPKRHDFLHIWNKGSLAEEYYNNYYLPVLLKYKDLESIYKLSHLNELLNNNCIMIDYFDSEKFIAFTSRFINFKNGKIFIDILKDKCSYTVN